MRRELRFLSGLWPIPSREGPPSLPNRRSASPSSRHERVDLQADGEPPSHRLGIVCACALRTFLATFEGPARAVRCALAITSAVRDLGIDVRIGLHTGEIELEGDDVRGIAVDIGARVSALAEPAQVLVSSTVKDLVAGSGLSFDDRGEHELKGLTKRWRLYQVISASA